MLNNKIKLERRKNMKAIKYSIIIFVAALIISVNGVFAGKVSSSGVVGTYFEIGVGKTVKSDEWTKGNDFNVQSYQFQDAQTTITNPCPNCKFKVTLKKSNGNTLGTVTGKTGNNYYFDNKLNQLSSLAGDYYIQVSRSGITAVTSYHTGDWYIAKSNSKAVYQN